MALAAAQLLAGLLYFFTVSTGEDGRGMFGLLIAAAAAAEGGMVVLGHALYRHAMRPADQPDEGSSAVPAELLVSRMKQLSLVDSRLRPQEPTVCLPRALPPLLPALVPRLVCQDYWQHGRCGILFLCSGGEALLFLRPRDSADPLERRHGALSTGAIQEHTALVGQLWPDAASAAQWLTCAADVISQRHPTATLDALPGARQRDLGPLLTPHIHRWLKTNSGRLQEALVWLYAVLNLYEDGTMPIPSIYTDPAALPQDLVKRMRADGVHLEQTLCTAGTAYTHTRRGYGGWHGDCEDVVCKVVLSATASGWRWRQETLWHHHKRGMALS